MDVWHKETTPGTTGSRCTIRDGGGLFVAECIASDASRIVEVPAMVEALRRILQWIDAGCDPSRKSLENARAILSRIDGAGPPLSAYAETVTDAEYREIANGRASWPLKGAPRDGAGDTLPVAPVPAPTSDAPSMADLLDFAETAARGNTDADDLQAMAQRLLAVVQGEN